MTRGKERPSIQVWVLGSSETAWISMMDDGNVWNCYQSQITPCVKKMGQIRCFFVWFHDSSLALVDPRINAYKFHFEIYLSNFKGMTSSCPFLRALPLDGVYLTHLCVPRFLLSPINMYSVTKPKLYSHTLNSHQQSNSVHSQITLRPQPSDSI